MKPAFFFLLALLAAIGLASPSIVSSSLSLAPNASNANDISKQDLLRGDPELKAWFAQLNEATRRNETWRAGHYPEVVGNATDFPYNGSVSGDSSFNVTTAADNKRAPPDLEGYYQVDVRIGRGSVHTGTLRKGRMFQRIYSTLKNCELAQSPGECNNMGGFGPCHCDIKYIVFDTEKPGTYRWSSDSYLKLRPEYSYFDVDRHPDIQDLGFRIIARIYELMTMQSNNCRYVNFPSMFNTLPTYMCSVADQVELAFPINGGVIQGVLNVKLEWSRKTKEGTYTCEGDTEADVDAMMWTDFRDDIAKGMNWPEKQILPFVYCTDAPCFRQLLNPGHAWKENKDCTPLNWPLGCDPELKGPPNPKLNCPPSTEFKEAPGKPSRQNKALSIIYQHWVGESGSKINSWLFIPGDYGVDRVCAAEDHAQKMVPAPGGDNTVINPPWPGGTFELNSLHGLECGYKNDGSNPGALFCQDWDADKKGPKNRKIQCKIDPVGALQKADNCKSGGKEKEDRRHKVVTCDW